MEEINLRKEACAVQHPLLTDCWATINGLKLHLQQGRSKDIQEHYYNGWMHDHYITAVFCFYLDGIIPIAFCNVPGSVHDSQVAEFVNIYEKFVRICDLAT